MATISAASLAFSGIDSTFWLARALFAGALGSSLCAVFALHILSVYAEGVPDDVMEGSLEKTVADAPALLYLLSYMLASPAVIGAWSTIQVLAGLMVFTFTFDDDSSSRNTPVGSSIVAFRIIVCVPIGLSIITVMITLAVAELMWRMGFEEEDQPTGQNTQSS
jgi:hypothetical protein